MLRKLDPSLYHRAPVAPDAALRLRYLGTAGFVVQAAQRTLVLDPYVSRPGLLRTALFPMEPDATRIRRLLPEADDVLVGHAHYDHVLDAPLLCHHTGARLIGSPAVGLCGRAAGLPEEQIVVTRGRQDIPTGPGRVRGLPSRHGRVYFGRVSLPGDITAAPSWPPRFHALKHGLVLNWFVELGGRRLLHVDSADFDGEEWARLELDGGGVDVLCLCAIGRRYRPRYVQEAVERARPKVVVACHWDLFSTPYEQEPWLLPQVDLPGFCEEVQRAGSQPVILPFDGLLGVA